MKINLIVAIICTFACGAKGALTNVTCPVNATRAIPCGARAKPPCTCPLGKCCSKIGYCGPASLTDDLTPWCGDSCNADYSLTCQPYQPDRIALESEDRNKTERSCLPRLATPCFRSPTTATVVDSNYARSNFTCRPYCSDGCCYIFQPHRRVHFRSVAAVFGWVILSVMVALASAVILMDKVQKRYGLWYLAVELEMAEKYHNMNEDFNEMTGDPWKFKTRISDDKCSVREMVRKGRKKIRKCVIAGVGLGAAFATACLLYGTPELRGDASGLAFAPFLGPFCCYIWVTSAIASALVMYHFLIDRRCDYDISTGVAGTVAVLVLICFMPVIGGYDGVSGIAFTDSAPDTQSLKQNQNRYNALVYLGNSIFSIAVGILLYSQTNIIFGLLT